MLKLAVTPPVTPLEVVLQPGQAIHGRVVDDGGKPIRGVSVSVGRWKGQDSRLHLEAATDADGKFLLHDAPLNDAVYTFRKDGYRMVEDFPMSPEPNAASKEGYRVTFSAPLRVTGSIVDAETNRAPAKCLAIWGVDYDDGRAPYWQRLIGSKTIANGRYEFEFMQKSPRRIRVEADGYLPAVSRLFKPYDPDTGRVTYDFKLKKAAPLTGTVLSSEGKPLANAEVFLATQPFNVNDRKPWSQCMVNARMARADAAGRFELPPEVEPFYLVVLHDQGYAVIDEKQFTATPAVRIQPWTAENRNFRVERRPSTFQGNPPIGKATNALTVRVVDVDGKPVEGAHVAGIAEYRISPHQFVPYDSGWTYFPNVLSDGNGMARIADPYNRCVVARHVERKLVAVRSISPQQMKGTDVLTLTMQPQCTVSGKLTAKELTARNRKLTWSNVYVCLGDGMERPMSLHVGEGRLPFLPSAGHFHVDCLCHGYATRSEDHHRETGAGETRSRAERLASCGAGPARRQAGPRASRCRGLEERRADQAIGPARQGGDFGVLDAMERKACRRNHAGPVPRLRQVSRSGIGHHRSSPARIRLECHLEERIAEIKKPFWKDRDLPISIAVAL